MSSIFFFQSILQLFFKFPVYNLQWKILFASSVMNTLGNKYWPFPHTKKDLSNFIIAVTTVCMESCFQAWPPNKNICGALS